MTTSIVGLLLVLTLPLVKPATAFAQSGQAHFVTASFTSKFSSYPQPQDFYRLLNEKFPFAFLSDDGSNLEECLAEDANDVDPGPPSGQNDPSTGQPISAEPSVAFVRWYMSCVVPIVNKDVAGALVFGYGPNHYLSDSTWNALKALALKYPYLPTPLIDDYFGGPKDDHPDQHGKEIMAIPYQNIPANLQQAISMDLFDRFIGPGVLSNARETQYLGALDRAAAKSFESTKPDLSQYIARYVLMMILTPEFLTTAP